jgi:DNA invertase Pin-like site-specific DNA recombinase
MHYWKKKPLSMMGYARVSTKRQEKEGGSLDEQVYKMQAFASENCFRLDEIYSEPASASGLESHLRRLELGDVVRRALDDGAPILVASLDRLARNIAAIELLGARGLEIYSVADGGRVAKRQLRKAIRQAEEEAQSISKSAHQAWESTKRENRRRRHSTPTAQQRHSGTINNSLRADRNTKAIAEYLRKHPELMSFGSRCLHRVLNDAGILNITSERHDLKKPWTKDSLFGPLKKARELLTFETTLEEDEPSVTLGFEAIQPNEDISGTEQPTSFDSKPFGRGGDVQEQGESE